MLLVRASRRTGLAGCWFLPGGGVDHGEGPADCVRRELEEETGLVLDEATLVGVLSDTAVLGDGTRLHSLRIVYRADRWHGELGSEEDGSTDGAAWVERRDVGCLGVLPYVTEALERFG